MIGMSKWLPLLNLVVFYYFLTYPSVGERSEIVETLFPPLLVSHQSVGQGIPGIQIFVSGWFGSGDAHNRQFPVISGMTDNRKSACFHAGIQFGST